MTGDVRVGSPTLQVAIDLNAVPPAGISGIDATDSQGARRRPVLRPIGIGGTKMKIHRAAIQKLFTANNLVLDAEEVLAIGQELVGRFQSVRSSAGRVENPFYNAAAACPVRLALDSP
jgi:hypothetical protein